MDVKDGAGLLDLLTQDQARLACRELEVDDRAVELRPIHMGVAHHPVEKILHEARRVGGVAQLLDRRVGVTVGGDGAQRTMQHGQGRTDAISGQAQEFLIGQLVIVIDSGDLRDVAQRQDHGSGRWVTSETRYRCLDPARYASLGAQRNTFHAASITTAGWRSAIKARPCESAQPATHCAVPSRRTSSSHPSRSREA